MHVSGEITTSWALRHAARASALGLGTSWAVAWALAAWLPHRNLQKQFDSIWPERGGSWAMVWVNEYRRPGMARRLWQVRAAYPDARAFPNSFDSRLGSDRRTGRWAWRDWGALERIVRETDPAVTTIGADDARGWPFRAVWCEIHPAGPGPTSRLWHAPGGVIIAGASDPDIAAVRVLPWRPLWSGLFADWAIYAAAWFSAALATAWLVGKARRRRGGCRRCGYDLAGAPDAGCSECGWSRADTPPAPTVADCPDTRSVR